MQTVTTDTTKRYFLNLTLQELRDEESEIKSNLQQARKVGNNEVIRAWVKDLIYCQTLIRNHN